MDTPIGVIGRGRFGGYFSALLRAADYQVKTFDLVDHPENSPFEDLVHCGVVFYAVPIRSLREAIVQTRGFLDPDATICDLCSVKMIPCEILKETLPDHALYGLHPLFGPQSAPTTCANQRIAVCPLNRMDHRIEEILSALGLRAVQCTPEEHDTQMAYSQFITHFIGRGASAAGLSVVPLSTKTHDDLMEIVQIVTGNSKDLFHDMATFNPMVTRARKHFLRSLAALDRELDALEMEQTQMPSDETGVLP